MASRDKSMAPSSDSSASRLWGGTRPDRPVSTSLITIGYSGQVVGGYRMVAPRTCAEPGEAGWESPHSRGKSVESTVDNSCGSRDAIVEHPVERWGQGSRRVEGAPRLTGPDRSVTTRAVTAGPVTLR